MSAGSHPKFFLPSMDFPHFMVIYGNITRHLRGWCFFDFSNFTMAHGCTLKPAPRWQCWQSRHCGDSHDDQLGQRSRCGGRRWTDDLFTDFQLATSGHGGREYRCDLDGLGGAS